MLTRLALLAAASAAVLAPLTAPRVQALTPAPEGGMVHAPGGPFMTDDAGRRLQFRGVNLVAKCGAHTAPAAAPGTPCVPNAGADAPAYYLSVDPAQPDAARRLTDTDAQTLQNLGFTLARVGITWAALEPAPPSGPDGANQDRYCAQHPHGQAFAPLAAADEPYDAATIAAYLAHVDSVIELLARHGIRSLVDMHQDAWGEAYSNAASGTPWKAEGAPPWATCDAPFADAHSATWQGAYSGDGRVSRTFAHFWANDVAGDLQGEFIRSWQTVAAHYRGNAAVVGYDLLNEPFDFTTPATPEFDRKLQCFYAGSDRAPVSCAAGVPPPQAPPVGLIPALQQADPDHLVFYEPAITTELLPLLTIGTVEPLPFANLVFSFHDYGASTTLRGGFECTDPSCGPNEQAVLTAAQSYRAAVRSGADGTSTPAWLLSEFGAENFTDDIGRVAGLAESYLVPWTYWAGKQLDDPTGGPQEALIRDDGTLEAAKAAVLSRTYPMATAGTPTSEGFDAQSAVFSMEYTPDPSVHAPTEIFVPLALHYPAGYRVTVRGAVVTSACGAPVLTLANAAGASQVTVRVEPGACPAAPSGGVAGLTSSPDTGASTGSGAGAAAALMLLAGLAGVRRTRPR